MRIINQIRNREKLRYTISNVLQARCRKIGCCRGISFAEAHRQALYANGLEKINKELDIRYIVKELRTMKFISQIVLTKYQRFMLPHFKANLLNYVPRP